MLSTFPWPDGARVLGEGDSTLDPAFSHILVAAFLEKLRSNRNPITSPAAIGQGTLRAQRGFTWVNRGVSGYEISNVVTKTTTDITIFSPTHHVFAAGINDVQRSVLLATSVTNFNAYLDLTAGLGKPTLVLLPFFFAAMGAAVVTFNAAMTVAATAHAGAANIMLVDQYAVLNAAVNSVNYTSPDTDICHPNTAWRAALAAYLLPLVTT